MKRQLVKLQLKFYVHQHQNVVIQVVAKELMLPATQEEVAVLQ